MAHKILGAALMIVGGALTLTGIGAEIGAPMAVAGYAIYSSEDKKGEKD